MRKVIVSEYLTLDGVMEEPGTWSFQFWSDESAKYKYDELFASDALLLGRVTYEGFAKAWPTMKDTGEFGERMNGLPKYVVSTTLDKAEWNNSTIIKANVVEEVSRLKAMPGQDILVAGSGKLVHTLMQHNLIDEYRFMIYPLILGSGKRLFRDESDRKVLRLVNTQSFSSGIVVLYYQPA
ncbi:MAG: dihydrofolate reductase family protein [Ktedonobacteraceae bacterium]